MNIAFLYRRFLILCMTGIVALMVWLLPNLGQPESSQYLEVHFLDVGQGDATLIETPDGVQVLIDGGADGLVVSELSKKLPARDRTIDVIVATHPDRDHIGGLIDVLERYAVASILMTDKVGDTATAATFQDRVQSESANIVIARRGQTVKLGASTTLRVMYPEGSVQNAETNAASVIVQLEYDSVRFLLTGDAPKRIEDYLVLTEGEYLQSDVLKIGHHGSRTSTSELFLDEVRPDYAVISAGADNRHGHPHVEITDLLFNKRVETYNTAESGTVTFLSDGRSVWLD